jgi:dolichyl-phosphate beta-glucosyltransferase
MTFNSAVNATVCNDLMNFNFPRSKVTVLLLVSPLAIAFLITPYLKWKREGGTSVEQLAEKSSLPKNRHSVRLSVVVPAYNETERLPAMMNEAIAYLNDRRNQEPKFSWEIIVVDDHSSDSTFDLATSFNTEATPVYAIRLKRNAGKGGAVRMGVLNSVGDTVLMADADGATKFSDIENLEREYDPTTGVEVVFGSRHKLETSAAVQKRHPLRNLLMYGFHMAVVLIIGTHIKDTQCGFKLFSNRAGKLLFRSLHLQRWAFDTEIVLLCRLLNFKVAEIDVTWTEIEGSKLNPALAAIQMLRDMILLRLLYTLNVWTPIIG